MQTATLTVQANPPFGGIATGSGSYQVGSNVTITAGAQRGWLFTGWADGSMLTARIVPVPANGATYTANFRHRPPVDYDGDGKSDIGVFDRSASAWYRFASTAGYSNGVTGTGSTISVTGDFDGDGRADIATFDRRNADWIFNTSSSGTYTTNFGNACGIPVSADFDGDGIADFGTYTPSNGLWQLWESFTFPRSKGVSSSDAKFRAVSNTVTIQFGFAGTLPVPADYDGDGRSDIGVYDPASGTWYVFRSSLGFWQTQFGYCGAIPVAADFDGDGKADISVFDVTTSDWFTFGSTSGFSQTTFGIRFGWPVTGDFDGDGKADMVVYTDRDGMWNIHPSTQVRPVQTQFGFPQTVPLK
jgi:hypothetical protein